MPQQEYPNKLTSFLLDECNAKRKGGIYHKTQVQLAYNSNRIEGSKLTEEQTPGFLIGTMQSAQDVYEAWITYFNPDLQEGLKME